MQQLDYKNEVIIPALFAYGSWTLNDRVSYYNSNLMGCYKVIHKTSGQDQIIDFDTVEAMAADINKNIFN